ncbi:MAG: hypothetical protein K0V04_36845 [Deltaproteobacteria bacterium]|nr:hypothetical protein [Deltaproteobacteria bacterium]
MNKKDLEQKKALKKKALQEALLKTVQGGATAHHNPKFPGPVNFICTFDPNPAVDPIGPF